MKSVDASVRNAIRSAHDIKALPRLTAEWNMNRYAETVQVANWIGDWWETVENDVDHFPLDSIIEPIRPSKGINKARVDYGTISDSYTSPSMPRYYIASLEDKYKYWCSPYPSDAGGNIGSVAPAVMYGTAGTFVKVNKIVVTIENSWASPANWAIQTTVDHGASWQSASSSPAIGGDGRAILYWNGSGWSSTRPNTLTATTNINGVRVIVTRLEGGRGVDNSPTYARMSPARGGQVLATNGSNSYFSLIEISARLEMDLSADLINVADKFDAGEASQVTPVGTITSNVSQLNIWNGDNVFSNAMAGLMEPNVKMNLEYVYHIGAARYPVQQFSMYTEEWNENEDSTISVDLSDSSKYLKEIYPREAKYENLTLAQIVYRLLDSVGFTDYNIVNYGNINDFRIPVFWTDGESTIWEIFDDLSTATQSLIYFDAFGKLNVKSRENAYNPARPIDWTLRGETVGSELADIEALSQSGQYDANLIKVKYRKAAWAEEVNGFIKNTTVWSPEDTVVLRSTPMLGGLNQGDDWFLISPGEAAHWPYEGHIQIEGEFIEYSGKHFNYREGGAWKSIYIHDQKEFDKYNELGGVYERGYNHFSGYFAIKERGVWNTDDVTHTAEAKGWEVKNYNLDGNAAWNTRACWQYHPGSSLVRLSSNGVLPTLRNWAISYRGVFSDAPFRHFGTRFRFNGAALHHRGGICFNQGNNGDGYFVEVRPSNTIENKDRDKEDEIIIYAIHNGNIWQMKSQFKPHDLIVADVWHDLALTFDPGSHRITVWLDGKKVMSDNIIPAYRHNPSGRFGMFIRGQTNMDFEYIYALSGDEPELADDVSFLDRTRGAYVGNVWEKDRVYRQGTRSRWVKRKGKKKKLVRNEKYTYANFMDEFGPYVHEVREFDVKFDPAPVKSANLYFTNDWQVVCPVFRSGSHGAYFILANASRNNAVVQGDDDFSFAAAGESVPQQLLVMGRNLVVSEDEEIEVRNERQIRSRGEIIAEIDSDWIQNEGAAQAVADWIATHWSRGADQLEVSVFGNTLFEVGDVVGIEFPDKSMTSGTHQYFVTGIETEFNSGIETSVTLQRKN